MERHHPRWLPHHYPNTMTVPNHHPGSGDGKHTSWTLDGGRYTREHCVLARGVLRPGRFGCLSEDLLHDSFWVGVLGVGFLLGVEVERGAKIGAGYVVGVARGENELMVASLR